MVLSDSWHFVEREHTEQNFVIEKHEERRQTDGSGQCFIQNLVSTLVWKGLCMPSFKLSSVAV